MNTYHDSQPGRRTFLKTTAAASAPLLAGRAVRGQEAAQDTSEVRIGIVGAGGRGTGALNDSLTINDNVKVVAVADLTEQKGQRLRDILGRKHEGKVAIDDTAIHTGLDGYQKVLEDPNVDLVIFATPPGFRPRHIAEAVQAGKHVFAEKPTCVDPAGYRICLAAHEEAEKRGTAIVTGTQYRRQVNYIEAVKQIRDGAIGDIISATSRYCSTGIWFKNRQDSMSDTEYQIFNWMHYVWLSGDQIAEQAVHNIDAMNWVMGGAPDSAYGSGGRFTRPETSEMWDSMSIDYVYPGNRTLSFMCRQIPGSTGDNSNTIYGTEGIAHIGAMSQGSRITDRNGKEIWSKKGRISDAYKQEHKDLVDSIRAGQPIVELKQTADSSLTAVLGRVAAYTGRRVTWEFLTEQSQLDLYPEALDWTAARPESRHAVPGQTKLV